FYAAGGEEPGDLPWPWWTGDVTVTLTATDGACTARAEVPVRIAGDVLVADYNRSHLVTVGSDGQVLGRFVQVTDRGLRGLMQLPLEQGGDLIVAVRGDEEHAPMLRRIDREGATVLDFETTDLAGARLWPDDRMAHDLAWDPINQLVVADYGPDGTIHRFRPNGEYVDSLTVPDAAGQFRGTAIGFAVLGDGTLLAVGRDQRNVQRLVNGAFEVITSCPDGCTALGTGHDGGAVVVAGGENDVEWFFVDARGRDSLQQEDFLGFDVTAVVRFMDGYLGVPSIGSRIPYLNARLEYVTEDPPIRIQGGFDVLPQPEGVLWLHDF
ncbi:MAG: hypothetical protein KC583_10880, partial [Myxococcales bacterium]|nr:hypothetical protein [Myxococcales bacterium]